MKQDIEIPVAIALLFAVVLFLLLQNRTIPWSTLEAVWGANRTLLSVGACALAVNFVWMISGLERLFGIRKHRLHNLLGNTRSPRPLSTKTILISLVIGCITYLFLGISDVGNLKAASIYKEHEEEQRVLRDRVRRGHRLRA